MITLICSSRLAELMRREASSGWREGYLEGRRDADKSNAEQRAWEKEREAELYASACESVESWKSRALTVEDWCRSMGEKEIGLRIGAGSHGITDTPAKPDAGVVSDEPLLGVVWNERTESAHLIKRGTEDEFCAEYGCRRVFLASRHARQVPDGWSFRVIDGSWAGMLSLEWIVRHCDAPEQAAWSKYRGIDAIRHKAQHALNCLDAAAPPATPETYCERSDCPCHMVVADCRHKKTRNAPPAPSEEVE